MSPSKNAFSSWATRRPIFETSKKIQISKLLKNKNKIPGCS
jgi:hypothetical protein